MNSGRGAWGELLLALVRQFLLLRDFFGYFLPGLTFAFLLGYAAIVFRGISLQVGLPTWLVLFLGAVTCYSAGHLLAAVGYTLQDVVARLFRETLKVGRKRTSKANRPPLRFEAMILYYRNLYPQLFIELDRRDTLALMRTGLGASFSLGCWLWPFGFPRITLLLVGLIFLCSGYAGRQHVLMYRIISLHAARRTERTSP